MQNLKAAYQNELFKISKKKKLIVAGILSAALLALIGLVLIGLNNITGIGLMSKGEFAILILPFFEYTIIPLFTAFVAIDMFSGEFSNDTIKLTLTRPISRTKVYFSKVLACATFLGAFLVFTMLVAVVVSLFNGFSAESLVKILITYIVTFIPLLVFSLMVMLVSNFSRGSASAFLISVVLFLTFKGLEFAFPIYKSFLFTAGFDWYKLFVGNYFNVSKILRQLLIFAGCGTVFLFGGIWLFDRRAI